MSRAAISEQIGVPAHLIGPYMRLQANLLVHADHYIRNCMEAAIAGFLPRTHLLGYIECNREDETPMSVGLRSGQAKNPAPAQVRATASHAIAPLHNYAAPAALNVQSVRKRVAKLLQSEQRYGMMIRTLDNKLLIIVGSSVTWTQMVDRTTAECLMEAEARRRSMSDHVHRFTSKTRTTTLDQAPSNKRKERILAKERGSEWTNINVDCELHISGIINRATFDALAGGIGSGLVHFVLSINIGANVDTFTSLVEKIAFARAVVTREPPSAEAKAYKAQLLRLSMSSGSFLLKRRLALLTLPSGDWRKKDRVEIYIPPALTVDHEEVKKVVAASLSQVVVGRQFSNYDKHRLLEPEKKHWMSSWYLRAYVEWLRQHIPNSAGG